MSLLATTVEPWQLFSRRSISHIEALIYSHGSLDYYGEVLEAWYLIVITP
jgi:hypothetical protein